ncbi:TonB-dependent receptor [Sphingosinicella rhizophila]|uniref:TonB-dependent receptor n=1 Tax=Sphingosinicella rhizophila TaxID=3050082 RepID=A0ABU3Q5W2_9SPHN|nr:TonB-dependent receptor [Sphingosinicella sp. GR2756]MDT9598801.1 TonB-dependent receptor [Sphingosinicella sp. GR2756]
MRTGADRFGRYLITALMMATAGQAAAQEQVPATDEGAGEAASSVPEQSGEIVVTARKREERLQDVPESIAVFSAESIEAANIENIRDVALNVPNLSISSAEQPGIALINIRGVGQVRNGEPPVAVIIDGVQLSNVNQFTQDLFDIERIEVLKGPQGAIYGRNAIGGAINIITRQPTNEFEGRIEGSYGTGDDFGARAAISGPIIADKLLFRLSGSFRSFDGDITNETLDQKVNFEDSNSIRLSLLARPSDDLTIDIRGSRSENQSGAAFYSYVPPGAQRTDLLPITGDILGEVDRTLYDASVKVEYRAPFATLTSISAYTRTKFALVEDFDFLPFDFLSGEQRFKSDAWSQELRASSDDGPVDWMFGVYLLKTDSTLDSEIYARPGAGGVLFPFPIPAPMLFVATRSTDDNLAYAGFGNVSFRPLPKLEISVGARYDVDERKQLDRAAPGQPTYEATFKSFQPKASLTFFASDAVNLYASAGKGFRSGGFNPSDRITRRYKSEENLSYEAGIKTSWLDRRLTFNAAAFYTDVDDRQIYLFDQVTGSQIITNPIPKSRIVGVEFDLSARPVPGLDISLSGGLLDSDIRRYDTDVFAGLPAEGDFTGNELPQVPNWSYAAAVQYRIPAGSDLTITPRLEANGRGGDFYWEVDNRDKRGAVHLVNARLSFDYRNFGVTAFVENLFDEEYLVDVVAQRFSGAPLGDYNMRSPGRRFGVIARAKF